MDQRLAKIIAARSNYSRRTAETLIQQGRVKVAGKTHTNLGQPVSETAAITVNGIVLPPKSEPVALAWYKPKGVVCSRERQGGTPIYTDFFTSYPNILLAGRLDKDSEGLIIATNDGALINHLTHPKHALEKTYYIEGLAAKKLTAETIGKNFMKGVKLGDGLAKATSVDVRELLEDNHVKFLITVTEGRHHLVRRMCATLGIKVKKLKRTKIGPLSFPRLKPGNYQKLTTKDLRSLSYGLPS